MLIQKGNRTYSGFESDLPGELPSGSIFISTDTTHIYIYNDDSLPILLNGPMRFTRSEIELIINNNGLLVGKLYTITDADVNLYGGTEITLTAITPSELSLQGSGLFYCPKYDLSTPGYGIWTKYMEGSFSNVVGTFNSGEIVTSNEGATAIYLANGFLEWISGDWSSATSITGNSSSTTADILGFTSPSYTTGQIVHWGGKSWQSIGGEIGIDIDKYTLDLEWTEIPFNDINYNIFIDEIHYDFDNDMIVYRKDQYNNIVSGNNQVFVELESPDGYGYGNPIKDFQWGCGQDDFNTIDYIYIGIQNNKVIDSYFETLNMRNLEIKLNELVGFSLIANTISFGSRVCDNYLSDYSGIYDNIFIGGNLSRNYLSQSSLINNNKCGAPSDNIIRSGGRIYNNTGISSIYENTLNGGMIYGNILNGPIYNNILNNHPNLSSINSGAIWGNIIIKGAINNNRLDAGTNELTGSIFKNTLNGGVVSGEGSIFKNTLNGGVMPGEGSIHDNILGDIGSIYLNTLNMGSINNNTLKEYSITSNDMRNSFFRFDVMTTNIQNCVANNFNLINTSIILIGSTIIGSSFHKNLFDRPDGIPRLQYVNNSDVIVISDINT